MATVTKYEVNPHRANPREMRCGELVTAEVSATIAPGSNGSVRLRIPGPVDCTFEDGSKEVTRPCASPGCQITFNVRFNGPPGRYNFYLEARAKDDLSSHRRDRIVRVVCE